jgi:catechol 2,3-dioxygenase-like lactoylglutathione lyase family enzyme
MSDETNDGGFDPGTFPTVASADASLPGTVELGVFSLSLSVADLDASVEFYGKLGFVVTGGDAESGWVILKNGETTLGLFHAMFERNLLTFNPGLTPRMERIEQFTDIRDLQRSLEAAGLTVDSAIEPGSSGPGSLRLIDPDGNPILIDQFF